MLKTWLTWLPAFIIASVDSKSLYSAKFHSRHILTVTFVSSEEEQEKEGKKRKKGQEREKETYIFSLFKPIHSLLMPPPEVDPQIKARGKDVYWYKTDIGDVSEPARRLLENYSRIHPDRVVPHVAEVVSSPHRLVYIRRPINQG